MDRTFNKAKNLKEAEKWDIQQQINMTPRQRQQIAYELKRRFYGDSPPDVRNIKK